MHPRKEKSVVHFNLTVDFNSLYYSKEGYGHATNGVMTQHEVKCTPKNQCKCIVSMKIGYATMWNAQFFLQMMNANFSYMKS